jgi:hypothetical protein
MTKRTGKNSFETDARGLSQWMQDRKPAVLQLPIYAAVLADGATIVSAATQCYAISYPDANYPGAAWNFMLPSAWAGKTMTCTFLWSPNSTNAGNCYWSVAATRVTDGVALPTAVTTQTKTAIAASGVVNKAKKSSIEVALTSFVEGDGLVIVIYRDTVTSGTDTFTGTAYLSNAACRVK